MDELQGSGPSAPAGGPEPTMEAVIDQAGRQLRAPWAASIAGLLFALLFKWGCC
jgi:hypothetical protein